jgi:DNA-binding IclR family transcriptional regulator
VGKSLLAFAGVPFPHPTELDPYTKRTITDIDRLHIHMDEVRQRGYAVDDEEYDPGVRCIAAPVLDASGIAIASIGISGPTVRVTPERVAELAHTITRQAKALSAAVIKHASMNGKEGRTSRE